VNESIKITKRTCIEPSCQKEYEAKEANMLGVKMVFGMGYCPDCARRRFEEEESREKQLRERQVEAKREEWRRSCGIPYRFISERFDTFRSDRSNSLKRAYNRCVEYADNLPLRNSHGYQSLVLTSDKVWGVGKTHLVCSIAHRILDRWDGDTGFMPLRFISEPNLFMRIRNTFNRQNNDDVRRETESDVYREMLTIPLLIVDDMGKEEVSDPRFVQRVWFAIINGRYDNMLPMVITANLNPDALAWHLGGNRDNSASFERIMEMTGNIFYQIDAKTYRDLRNRE